MEVEYKFLCQGELNHQKTMDIIDALNMSSKIQILSISFEHISTKYLDSTDGSLRKSRIAVRDRRERKEYFHNEDSYCELANKDLSELEKKSWKKFSAEVEKYLKNQNAKYDSHILSFKWGGFAENGLHKRSEVEFRKDEEEIDGSKLPHDIYKAYRDTKEKGIVTLFTTMVRRIKILSRLNDSNIEVCIDKGVLLKDEKDVSDITGKHILSEIELELNDGSEEDLKTLADFMLDKFNLIPNKMSKYQQGLNVYFDNRSACQNIKY